MRTKFDEQLTQLNNMLVEMGAMIEMAIAMSIKALEDQDAEAARKVIQFDDEIDQQEKEIEALCQKLLLQQQPVARDLRLISAALKMITDMERIGDQAGDIAELAAMLSGAPLSGTFEHIRQMAAATSKMVTDSINAFVNRDLALATSVIEYDDVVDALFTKARNDLIALIHEDRDCGEQAIDLMMIAKYLERIGDHAVNIAEWVEFSITGHHES